MTMKRPAIVIIEGQPEHLDIMRKLLESANYTLFTYDDPERALVSMAVHGADVLIADLEMPKIDGFAMLQTVRERWPNCHIITLTGYGCVEETVQAIKCGATEFLTKPLNLQSLLKMVERLVAYQSNAMAVESPTTPPPVFGGKQLKPIMELAVRAAETNCSILISGETGVGKEVIADYIQINSPRREWPYIKINCAALSETLIESELFGYEQGAFTGAARRHIGRFERANRGTVFLDEIGELSPTMQTKLLRVLQTREIERVGGTDTIKVDFRLISATHRDLEKMIAEGMFRQDLFYRINTLPLAIPPLRQRRDEIPKLARAFVQQNRCKYRIGPEDFDDDALAIVQSYNWPGNIRELENCMERACILARDRLIHAADLWWLNVATPAPVAAPAGVVALPMISTNTTPAQPNLTPLEQSEKETLQRVLTEYGWHFTQAAAALKVSRSTLYLKFNKYGLVSRRARAALEPSGNVCEIGRRSS